MFSHDLRDSASPLGITADFSAGAEPTTALLKDAGAGWIRLAFPERPDAGHDRLMDLLTESGIKILALLGHAPAAALVQRYKDRVRHWEIGNEPDDERFWQPQDGMRSYTAHLQEAARTIRAEDPTAVVHLGGLGRGLPKSLKNIYAHGGRDAFDVVHMHPFINPLMPDAIGGLRYFHSTVRQVMDEQGDAAKPIWYSHIGCPGMADPKQAPDWWLGKNPTEAVQADWVRALYEKALAWPGVEKIFWAALSDTPNRSQNGTDFMGLARAGWGRKPAFEAYQRAASLSRR